MTTMSIEPFNKLVKLAARAFYDDYSTKADNQPKNSRSDNRGMAVVILDALTRRQWVREEDLAKDLKLHSKQLRRALKFFEEEKLVMRDNRKETAKGVRMHNAAIAATANGHYQREDEDKIKLHTHSYCCLDYAQIYDVVRYRMHRIKKKLKDELDSRNTIQEYICPNCSKRYNALDATRLVSMEDEYFHCESCNGELVAESDKLAAQDIGDADDNARRRRREKLKELLQKLEEQLKPLVEQINRVKDLTVPEFGNLQDWEARASNAMRGGPGQNDLSRSSQGGTPMPFLGETKVEVAISGMQDKDDSKSETANAPAMKELPPWMIRQGMILTKEQRGEVKDEAKMAESSAASGLSDDKKSAVGEQEKNYQEEYYKEYYKAILKAQREKEAREQLPDRHTTDQGTSLDRQVGMKSKREEVEDDVEWEEGAPSENTRKSYKVNDLNVEAEAEAPAEEEEDDDDVEWEEG